jgi:hypothetical protein
LCEINPFLQKTPVKSITKPRQILPYRPNPRSKAALASKQNLYDVKSTNNSQIYRKEMNKLLRMTKFEEE